MLKTLVAERYATATSPSTFPAGGSDVGSLPDSMLGWWLRTGKHQCAPAKMPKMRSHAGVKTESGRRRLAKYSRYNRSAKGRARVERYRAMPYVLADGLVMRTKGIQNRETSSTRRLDRRITTGELTMREMLAAYYAKLRS